MIASVSAGCMVGDPVEQTASIDMSLQLGPGVTVNTVDWTISNSSTGFTRTGSVDVRFSNTVQFVTGAIPAGEGYSIALAATSVDGAFSCTGSGSFSVAAGSVTPISLTFNCSTAPADEGTIVVSGTTQICANLDSISAAPLETAVNKPISVSATGSAGPIPVSFTWSATGGSFNDPTIPSPVFTCPSTPGPVTITVDVSPSAPSCSTIMSRSVTVDCSTLAPTFTNVYSSIIGVRCTGCHRPTGSGVNVGLLDMSTQAIAYSSLVGVAAQGTGTGTSGVTCASTSLIRVIAGDAPNSLLFNKTHSKLLGTLPPCGSPMPPSTMSAPLTQQELDLLGAWINAGAPND
ncbi:MAG: hypothetical protein AB7O24_23380 [Kofleriaceae bacterium]